MENKNISNVQVEDTTGAKKKTLKEKRLERKKAKFEAMKTMSYEEYEEANRKKFVNGLKIFGVVASTASAAFVASKAAACNYYTEAITTDTQPTLPDMPMEPPTAEPIQNTMDVTPPVVEPVQVDIDP